MNFVPKSAGRRHPAARTSYAKMIAINPDLDESKNAKNYLTQITAILPKLGCKT